VAEVYSHSLRVDKNTAEMAVKRVIATGVHVREDMDWALCLRAVEWRRSHRMSWPDALGIALAERLSADWITSDHHEFDAVDQADAYRVTFIRLLAPVTSRSLAGAGSRSPVRRIPSAGVRSESFSLVRSAGFCPQRPAGSE
jgi:hypothetical protein